MDGHDLFSWSIPYLADKIQDMLMNVVNQCTTRELRMAEEADVKQVLEDQMDAENDKAARKMRLKNKIRAAGRMAIMLKDLRLGKDEHIKMEKMKSSDGKIDQE
jgi:serine/threonine-protein phosphatase 2B catalytic subunit